VEPLITPRTKAILPVHYAGKIAPVSTLRQLARDHHLLLIEDAAQAFGASRNGQPAGSFGDMACFSMNPMKVFGACGEAGMVVTDQPEVYEKLLALRYNGMVNLEQCQQPGLNGRLDTLQAAILLVRLP
jgi:dTDP-4-amino-4,6-dideoxygalactose transaminase